MRDGRAVLRDEVVEYAKVRTANASPPALILISISADGEDYLCTGKLSQASNETPTLDTMFEIGSNTKVLVALALSRLVDAGMVNLTDAAQAFLPTGVTLPTRHGEHIRLIDLATHTAALPAMPNNFDYANPWESFKDFSLDDLHAFLERVQLNWDIGTSYVYSNVGYALLGLILEQISNKRYDALIADSVCAPLGMHHTGVSPSGTSSTAKSHQGKKEVPLTQFGALGPAGGFRSTARDLITFIKANLRPEETQLARALRSATEVRFSESTLSQVALGWHVQTRNGKTMIWHRGETLGQTSFIGFEPRQNSGVVMLSNAALGTCCCDLAISQLDDSVLPRERQKTAEITLRSSDLAKFEGTYGWQPQVSMYLTAQADHLRVEINGQRGGSMYPVASREFITKDQRIRIQFIEEKQQVLGFYLTQHGGIERFVHRISMS